jgi:hypothetical protein
VSSFPLDRNLYFDSLINIPSEVKRTLVPNFKRLEPQNPQKTQKELFLECGDNPAEAETAPFFLTSQKRRRSEYRLPPHAKSISASAPLRLCGKKLFLRLVPGVHPGAA